eukprot:TRINITY_DN55351_c0_g1_i1.p2 TRINITY_DN55351_c0_g1~~TRINITY_DN55351_c0_g1_i1.p2  ORF type:complete len:211 (+),score=43.70 TRINITY_DN55351_c0_g1_i1:149-781(+)
MPIIYAAAADRNEVKAEHPEADYPKLADVCRRIIARVPLTETGKHTFEDETYNFHYKSRQGRVIICVAHKEVRMRVAYAFLEAVEKDWSTGINKKLLKDKMEFHNNPANDNIGRLQKEIDECKDIMMDNLDKVMARGEKLDALAQKSDDLRESANDFHRSAVRVRRMFCLKHAKITIILVVVVIVVIIIILLFACKPDFSRCKSVKKPSF